MPPVSHCARHYLVTCCATCIPPVQFSFLPWQQLKSRFFQFHLPTVMECPVFFQFHLSTVVDCPVFFQFLLSRVVGCPVFFQFHLPPVVGCPVFFQFHLSRVVECPVLFQFHFVRPSSLPVPFPVPFADFLWFSTICVADLFFAKKRNISLCLRNQTQPHTLCWTPAPPNLNVPAHVLAKVTLRVWFLSSIGANAPRVTSTLNLGGEGAVSDRKGLNISSIYSRMMDW